MSKMKKNAKKRKKIKKWYLQNWFYVVNYGKNAKKSKKSWFFAYDRGKKKWKESGL